MSTSFRESTALACSIVCILAQVVAAASAYIQETVGDDEVFFCEMHKFAYFDHAAGVSVSGPSVLRKSNAGGFVFPIVRHAPLGIKEMVPFVIAIECEDSMKILTDFQVVPDRLGGLNISGRIRFTEECIVCIIYELSSDGAESIRFLCDDVEVERTLRDGRGFSVSSDFRAKGVTQLNGDLVALASLPFIESVEATERDVYKVFEAALTDRLKTLSK